MKTERKADFFDSRAENWEQTCYPPDVRARLEELIDEFGVKQGENILDIGTGPGVLVPYLRDRLGQNGRVCAFDFSMEMARQAMRKLKNNADTVLRADVHHIPFKDETFDRAICFAAFPHFFDPQKALREMARAVRPGGTVIVAHLLSREELAEHHARHSSVKRDILPEEPQMRSLFSSAGLSISEIVDKPGRYLARASKPISSVKDRSR